VAFADAREEAAHAGGDRTGEQDDMHHADEAESYRDPALGNGGVKGNCHGLAGTRKEMREVDALNGRMIQPIGNGKTGLAL
jgi:hypothetical protein